MCFPKMDHLIASVYNNVCIDLTKYSFSKTFSTAHCLTSKFSRSHYVYLVAFKNATLCSSLFEIGMPYITEIIGVDSLFNKRSWNLTKSFFGCKNSPSWATSKNKQINKSQRRVHLYTYRFSREHMFRFILVFIQQYIYLIKHVLYVILY